MNAASVALCHDGEVLLIHRTDGTWSFPGGGAHEGENASECALRELKEEVGLSVEVGQDYAHAGFDTQAVVYTGKTKSGDASHYLVILIVPEKPEITQLQESEVQGYRWVSPEEASKWDDLHFGMRRDLKRLMLSPRVYLS